MSVEAWLTLSVLATCFGFLIFTRLSPDAVLFGGVIVLFCTGVLTPGEALAGFANEGLMTIAMMYIVATGLRETGGVELLVRYLLGRPTGIKHAQFRLMLPVTIMSAFMNNTPLVATFIPAVLSWSKRLQISPSKLLLPLSYAAILGGTCTLIGTSTNLVVNGLLTDSNLPGLTLFEIAWVGVPVAIAGLGYILLTGHWLLPERIPATATYDDPKEYTVEMQGAGKGPLVGKTVEEAGLRHLQGLFLVEIERDGRIIAAVGAKERLRANDRLVFVGVTESVVELQRIKGLRASVERTYNIKEFYPERCLVEAVVSPRCALLNETIRDGRFRTYYGATVIAVSRNGHRINGKIGNIRLQTADTLLLETRPSFIQRHRDSKDFLLISSVADSSPLRFERGWFAWFILGALVLAAGAGWLSMLKASLLGAMAMLLTGCGIVPNQIDHARRQGRSRAAAL